jgi:formate dehydrogenase
MPDSNRLRDAFKELDLLVALDILPSETASLAHYMLPSTTPLERPDLPFIFPLMLGLQMKPYLQATRAVVRPDGEQRDEASIYLDLCRFSGVKLFKSSIAQKVLEVFSKRQSTETNKLLNVPQTGILNLLLRVCGQKSFSALMKHPHGFLRPSHQTDFLSGRLQTGDKKVHLSPEILLKASESLASKFESEIINRDRYKLITKRAVKTHNSWTHNYEPFVKPPEHTNYLYISPLDADELHLIEGDLAVVTSETGTVSLPVRLCPDLLRKTVALPHGWGHQESGLQVAGKTTGVNVNILAPSGPGKIDPVSGMALLTGIYVTIGKVQDSQGQF